MRLTALAAPVAAVAGFVLFMVDLDLLPFGALFLLAGLAPLTASHESTEVVRDQVRSAR